jgi:hypothetical protein
VRSLIPAFRKEALTQVNSLLKKRDTTTIAALVGVGIGSFLLGVLVAIITSRILHRQSVALKQDTYSHPTTQDVSDGVYGGDPFSRSSLSQTFVRHSLKSPTNTLDSKEKSKLCSSASTFVRDPRDSGNPFSSIGQESVSSFASEVIPRFERVKLVGGHQVHVHNPWPSDTRSQRDFCIGQTFPRSVTESTLYETGSMTDISLTTTRSIGERVEPLGYPSQRPARPEHNRIHRARSDPRIAHFGGERPKLQLSAHELRRMRTFSSPDRNSDNDDDGRVPTTGHLISRRPRLTITPPSEAAVDPPRSSMALPNEQESDLARQMSQRAVLFYQEHAHSHLSLPLGGPLSSAVLPDSPSGVMGNSENPRRDFSLA